MPRMNRRIFMASAGLLSASAALPRSATQAYDVLAEVRRYRKIDCHNHVFPPHDVRDLISAADKLGIEKLAVSSPLTNPDPVKANPDAVREMNNRVLQAMKDFPGRLLGQCFVNPYYGREALEEMTRCMDAGMIGLGEMYTQVRITDPLYFPIIEKCIELKAPLLSHAAISRKDWREPDRPGGSNSDDFVEIGKRYPEALIIYGHIGGGGDWEYVCKTLRACPHHLRRHQRQRDGRRRGRSGGASALGCAGCSSPPILISKPASAKSWRPSSPRPSGGRFSSTTSTEFSAIEGTMSIDVHTYFGHYAFRHLRGNTASGLVSYMDRFGIERAVVASLSGILYKNTQPANEELAAAIAPYRGRFIPFAVINPTYAGWRDDLQACHGLGMKGVRLYPQYHDYKLADPRFGAIPGGGARFEYARVLYALAGGSSPVVVDGFEPGVED